MTTKPTVPDLKELFKQAAEIAKQVPEAMQEAAFNRAIDLLTHGISSASPQPRTLTRQLEKSNKANSPTRLASDSESLETLLSSVDSTQHPGVSSATKVIDRALMLLQIARNDHEIDGLTPSEIAKVLTAKFRIRTSAAACSMALGNATNLVNRIKEGQAYRYQIMSSGEAYLAQLGGLAPETISRKRGRNTSKTQTKESREAAKPKKTQKVKTSTKQSSNTGAKIGPKAAIQALIDGGYFSEARTGPEVQSYLSKKRGYNLGTPQLQLAMLRLVRDGKLDRDQNEAGHYEYTLFQS